MNLNPKMKWWLSLIAVILLPFLLVPFTYQAATYFPGTVNRNWWELTASSLFLVSLVLGLILLYKPTKHVIARIMGGIVLSLMMLFAAFIMQVHSTCEPINEYIGSKSDLQGSEVAQEAKDLELCS